MLGKIGFTQYDIVKRMSRKQFNQWLEIFGKSMYRQGYDEACKDVPDGSIVIKPSEYSVLEYDYEHIKEMLMSIKGISERIAIEILDKMYSDYEVKKGINNNKDSNL